jgi:maleate cis-trans isomerase
MTHTIETKPYGWRGRFGYVNPSIWDTTAYEFLKILPEGVMVTVYSLGVQRLTEDHFGRARSRLVEAVEALIGEEAQAVCIGGLLPMLREDYKTPAVIDDLRRRNGIPIQQTSRIVENAFRKLGVRKIGIVTPYRDATNAQVKTSFDNKGFEVMHIQGLGIERNVDLTRVSPEQMYRLAIEVAAKAPEAEALYFPCSRLAVASLIAPLEEEIGRPVVTNVQAVTWWALNAIGVDPCSTGFGKLLNLKASQS